jgi:hypothetical protein
VGGMFGSKEEDVTGGWRKFHDGELHKFYFSLDIIRMIR